MIRLIHYKEQKNVDEEKYICERGIIITDREDKININEILGDGFEVIHDIKIDKIFPKDMPKDQAWILDQ
jgi:hypothetical protein